MDSIDPQGSPGVNHEDGITGQILTSAETETELNGWTSPTTELNEVQKDEQSASRLLFLTVEYVEEHAADYAQSAFAGFEPGTPFSLQTSGSMSEFENRVSPLDPNMGSTARYSPVYTMSGNSNPLGLSEEISSNNPTISSNPSSPFQSQVVVLANPSSPLMNPPSNTLPSSPYTENSHDHSPMSGSVVTSAEMTQGFVHHMLSNPVASPITCSSSSPVNGDGLSRQVVADGSYFNQQTSTSSSNVLASGLGGSPLNPNSPNSPLQAPLTPADNYVVSSSTETIDAMEARPADFNSDASVSISNSPSVVDSNNEIMIHSSSMQSTSEIVAAADPSPFHSLETAGVMSTAHDVQMKHDPLDRVQLLINSSDGSISYSLDGQTSFLQTRIVDVGNELLAHRTSDTLNLSSLLNSFKAQGLVIGGENGDLQLHPSQNVEPNEEEKASEDLGLQEYALAVRQQQNELLQQTLLNTPINGDLTDNVTHLSESLLNDAVKISIVDPSLEAVGTYNDILMESACISNAIGSEISGNLQQTSEICDFAPPNTRMQKHLENSLLQGKEGDDCTAEKTLRNVANSSSFNDGCCSHFHSDDHKSILDCALSSLPACYLTISKLPPNKANELEYGVFARKTIPKKTQFGPIEGVLLGSSEFVQEPVQSELGKHLMFLIENELGHVQKLDISNENTPNWMSYVRVASSFKEQNLILNQQGQSLFFTTTKVIHPRQELRVWYSLPYARKHGLPSLHPVKFELPGSIDCAKTWSCFECNKNFTNPVYLQCHLNVHELDKLKEVSEGKSAEKENQNLNQKVIPTFQSKKQKNSHSKYESHVNEYHACNNDLQQKCCSKRCHVSHLKSRRYLCEVCGYQFTQLRNRECQVRRRLRDTNTNDSSKQVPTFPRKKIQKLYSECRKNKNKTGWYCYHCNLTFDSPSNCNLHTLVHAAENVEEVEIITDVANGFSSVPRKGVSGTDLCCPKCTKRVETSDINSSEVNSSKDLQPPHPLSIQSSRPEQPILIQTSTNTPCNVNEQGSFMNAQIVDLNTAEFLAQNTSEDHQLNSVLNSFKIEDEKLSGALDLQELSLAVQQPQNDLLEQTLLATPLTGDLTDGVVCFGHFDDVKISIVDSSLETVGAYTDILLEAACVENTIGNEITESSLTQQSSEMCSEFEQPKSEKQNLIPAIEQKLVYTQNIKNQDKEDNLKSEGFQHVVVKSERTRVSTLLSARYLAVRKISCKTEGESGYGVFARKTIHRRTRFGPIQGVLTSSSSEDCNEQTIKDHLDFLVETSYGKVQKLDISGKSTYNWARFVRVARSCNEQNIILYQEGQSLFFTTTKVIQPKEELRVWYSLVYAKKHGLPFLKPLKLELKDLTNPASTKSCFECSDCFESSVDLQYHLNIHNLERLEIRKFNDEECTKKTACCLCSKNVNHIKMNETCSSKCQSCRNQCRPCHLVHHNDFQKKQRPNTRNNKYLCGICGFQFSHSYSRDRHVRRYHKDVKINGTFNHTSAVPDKQTLKSDLNSRKNKTNSQWFCSHCNLTFNNASVCNLHTLVHAAENVEETEVITGLPNDFPTISKNIIDSDLRCPKCTKKVETSESTNLAVCEISKVLQSAPSITSPANSVPNEQMVISSTTDPRISLSLNEQTTFMETQDVGMDSTEFLVSHEADDVHQLSSVFNSLKMQGLVIDEAENGDLQIKCEETSAEEKLSGALGLSELTLAVDQQQNDLLQQTFLTGSLNEDLSESVAHLDQTLLNDDVKISIVDQSLEAVGAYTDILMENACVDNAIENEIARNGIALGTPKIHSNINHQNSIIPKKTSVAADANIKSHERKECSSSKSLKTTKGKAVLAIASFSLPAAYLTIRKLPQKKLKEDVYGVFARRILPKRTQFGPIEGILERNDLINTLPEILRKERATLQGLVLSVEKESGDIEKLDVAPGSPSYWIKYIRSAPSFRDQNLVLSQQGQSLYLTTTKVIYPKQELRAWYSLPYANKRNLPLLQHNILMKKNLDGMNKVWPCFECSEKFASSEGLQIHLNIHDFERDDEDCFDDHKMRKNNHNPRRKGGLHFCPRKYKSNSDKQNKGFPYQCHTCDRAFPRNYNLKRHLLLHAKDKKYSCEICGVQFTHAYNRDRHILKRHKDVSLNGNSKSLSVFLKKKLALKSSLQNGNNNNCKEWYCSHCNLIFDSLRVLNVHTWSHGCELTIGAENLKCPQCSEEFLDKKELIDHVTDHGKPSSQARLRGSLNPAKPWKCELCYKSFATEDRLQRHMLVHGTEESKPLQCDICYKRFLNNSALACHIKIHTGEKKMFECPICKLVFEQVLALKEHVQSHSENGVYTCPQCNKVFDGYSLIRKHIRAFHSDRKHTCNYCGKLFPKLDKLRMHMLRHSDHREFLCANCGKQFKRKDKLKEHMKRMHSAERELRLALKPHRPPTAKKFMPKVSPTDYHRFIYKCHTCLLGFKRRGMLVNHLAKRHPDISPESVPELNLPILKTTRDYYCQYCEKVYKSSSKRKAHILKIHPGAELPMSNRRKGGVPEIPGLPNPTFSQTVGSITTNPHGCPWCHKQYASKAKLLQHQRKKHIDLLPQSQQLTSTDEQDSQLPCAEQQIILPQSEHSIEHESDSTLTQLQGIENVINIIPGGYHIATTEEDLREFQESGIIIDTSAMERPLKVLSDGISADLLSQAMSELTSEFRVSVSSSPNDHYLRIVQTSPGHITVTQSPASPENLDKDSLTSTRNAVIDDSDSLSPNSVPNQTSSQLHRLLSESYSLPSSPSSTPSPQTWSNTHVTYTPYTAR